MRQKDHHSHHLPTQRGTSGLAKHHFWVCCHPFPCDLVLHVFDLLLPFFEVRGANGGIWHKHSWAGLISCKGFEQTQTECMRHTFEDDHRGAFIRQSGTKQLLQCSDFVFWPAQRTARLLNTSLCHCRGGNSLESGSTSSQLSRACVRMRVPESRFRGDVGLGLRQCAAKVPKRRMSLNQGFARQSLCERLASASGCSIAHCQSGQRTSNPLNGSGSTRPSS